MNGTYLLGVSLAVLSGAMNAFGAIFQKSAVNKISSTGHSQPFMTQLLKSPLWLTGLGMTLGVGTIFTLLSQKFIGPALVPGLAASGMIILAIASAKLLGEKLKPLEVLGILLMVVGIFSLGYSHLTIAAHEVNIQDGSLVMRIGLFTAGLGGCWSLSYLMAMRKHHQLRGLILAVSGGFPYCLSNLWILPMMVTIGPVFSGEGQANQLIIFVISCMMLVFTNLAGIRQVQEAYKLAPANKVQPIQQVPTQVIPILIYFYVYQRQAAGVEGMLIPAGVVLIILSGFLLARRKAEL